MNDLIKKTIETGLSNQVYKEKIKILKIKKLDIPNSIIKELGEGFIKEKYGDFILNKDFMGFNPLEISLTTNSLKETKKYNVVVNGKKAHGFVKIIEEAFAKYNIKLPFIFSKTLLYHEFKNIHCMDAKFLKLQLKYPLIGLFAPKYINDLIINDTYAYTICELIDNPQHLNDCKNTHKWDIDLFEKAIFSILNIHSVFYNKENIIRSIPGMNIKQRKSQWLENKIVWEKMVTGAHNLRQDIISDEILNIQKEIIDDINNWYGQFDDQPTTIIHGDFNPRNMGFRIKNNQLISIILDWECAREHVPQFDLMQFILYSCNSSNIIKLSEHLINYYRVEFNKLSNQNITEKQHYNMCLSCLKEMLISRIPLLIIIFKYLETPIDYGKILIKNSYALIKYMDKKISNL